jgi:hypothetical protein
MYCFHDKIRIYFMSFIVQISPFVHLFTLKIVFRWTPPSGLCPGPAVGLNRQPRHLAVSCAYISLHTYSYAPGV